MINPQKKIQILACVVALMLIIPMCYDIVSGFLLGFNTPDVSESADYLGYPIGFEIAPCASQIQEVATLDDELKSMELQRSSMIFLPAEYASSGVTITTTIISFLAIVCAIYYVVAVFKMASIVIRQGLLNSLALKQMRKVSYSMLTAYLLFAISSYLPTWYYSRVISLVDYEFVYPRMSEYFVIAVIFILLSEILNIALRLKEEQELTI